MGFTFQIEEEILIVKVSGQFTLKAALDVRDKAVRILREKQINRKILDIQEADLDVSVTDVYSFFRSFYAAYPVNFRHAYVTSAENYYPEIIAFCKTVAQNQGINVKWFTDIDEARAWLMK